MKQDSFLIGKIGAAHGIKGEMRFYAYTDDMDNLSAIPSLIIEGQSYPVQSMRLHKNILLIKLEGIDERNQAQALTHKEACIPRAFASKLNEGEYYIQDLLGAKLIDEKNQRTGILQQIIPMAGADVFCFLLTNRQQLLIPHRKAYIEEINIEEGVIRMDTTAGVITGEKA